MNKTPTTSANAVTDSARIGEGTTLGHFVVIGENVRIGKNCVIGHHVVLHDDTVLEDGVSVDDHAVIGKKPYRAANSAMPERADLPACHVGASSHIGTGAVLYRGASFGERVFVADLATVRENVTVGERTIVGRGVAIESDCRIGAHCKFETNAYITAFSTVEDDCFVAPCVATSNDNTIARGTGHGHFKGVTIKKGGRIGVHATILPGRIVEEDAVVAAGAVLTRDAEAGKVSQGVPAKTSRAVDPEQLLERFLARKSR